MRSWCRGRAPVVLALMLLAGLAGCVDEADPEVPQAPAGPREDLAPGVAQRPDDVLRQAAFPASAAAADLIETGTLGNEAICGTFLGDGTCPGADVYDLTEHLPLGARVRVLANLSYDGIEDTLGLGWRAADGTVHYSFVDGGPGWNVVEMHLLRSDDEPVQLGVYRDIPGSPGSGSYTLEVQVRDHQGAFENGQAVGVTVDATASALVLNATRPGGFVRVWDPADDFVGAFGLTERTVVPLRDTAGGTYVMQFRDAAGPVRLMTLQPNNTTAATLSLLQTESQVIWDETVSEPGTHRWRFDVETTPMFVGIVRGNEGDSIWVMDGRQELWSPGGERLLSISSSCYLCSGHGVWTTSGPGVEAGTYEGVLRVQHVHEAMVGHYLVRHVR